MVEKRFTTFEEFMTAMSEFHKSMAEQKSAMDKTDRMLKELSKEIRGVSDNIGYHAEQYFQTVFSKKLSLGKEKYDYMILNLKFEGKKSCEFDIVLVNGKSVAIIEAKNRIHPKFIQELAEKKTVQLREYFPKFKDYDLYLGVAGFLFDESVAQEAQKYGVGIIRQVGDAVEIDDKNLKVY